MNRRKLLALAAAAGAVEILSPFHNTWLAAAEPNPDAIVTVIRIDGTVARGKMISCDRDKITLDVLANPKDPPVSTDIKWDDIKTVTNGPTHQQVIQKWRLEHLRNLCETCFGDGKIFCLTCRGTAHDPAASAGCMTCHGAAHLRCTTPRCKEGWIPCPNPKCLKLTDDGWFKKADGLKWKRFGSKKGAYFEWSEHHCGQVVDFVKGHWENLGICPVCGGYAAVHDPVCRGTGDMPCPTCSKKTDSPPCPDKCHNGVITCPSCMGSGLRT